MKSVFFNEMETFDLPSDFIDSAMKIGGIDDKEQLNSAWRRFQVNVDTAADGVPSGLGCDVWVADKRDLITQKLDLSSDNSMSLAHHRRVHYCDPLGFHLEATCENSVFWTSKLASDVMPFWSNIFFVCRSSFPFSNEKPWEVQLDWTIALQCWQVPAEYGYLLVYTTGEGTEVFTSYEISKPGWYHPDPYTEPMYVFSRNNDNELIKKYFK